MTDWSSQQLTEFLTAVSAVPEESILLRSAAERAAEAVESEVAAVVIDGRVGTSIGFAAGEAPEELLLAIASGERPTELPGIGLAAILCGGPGA